MSSQTIIIVGCVGIGLLSFFSTGFHDFLTDMVLNTLIALGFTCIFRKMNRSSVFLRRCVLLVWPFGFAVGRFCKVPSTVE